MSSAPKDLKQLSAKQLKLLKLLLKQRGGGLKQTARLRRLQPQAQLQLSFAQQRLWFLDRLVPNSPFYNVPGAIRLHVPLNEQVLKKTLNEIVRRHEVLRTSFGETSGKPFLIVSPSVDVPFEVRDLRQFDPATRERESLRLVAEGAQRPFDLGEGPFLRALLLWLGEQDYIFLITLHHIVADAWSTGVLMEEFRQLYAAFSQGLPSPLPELEIQYADFAAWQRNRLVSGELQPQLKYWTTKLANLPLLELPTDFPHRAVQGFEGETQYVNFSSQLSEALRIFSQRNEVTLFATLFAAFNALLYRYTGQDEIVIGEPVANRTRTELEPLIGFFVNALILRTDVSGDPTFRELLRRSWQEALQVLDHQEVPFEVIVDLLKPERTMGRNPLFQVSLQYFSGSDAKSQRGTLLSETIHVEKGTASLDLAFDIYNSPQGILAQVEYSTELFRRETIQRMISHYQNLLEAFIANPELRLSEVPMLSSDEVQQVIRKWTPSLSEARSFTPVHELFEAQVLRSPEHVAVVCADKQLTYRQLNERANQLARTLKSNGVAPEKLVAICLDRSLETIVAVLAVWKAGGAYTPLDPSLPEERFQFLLSDAQPALIITDPNYAERIKDSGMPFVLCNDEATADATSENLSVQSHPDNLAYVIYTSGSSGTPKGVMVEHGAISKHLQWMQDEFPLSADDRTLFKYAFSFDVSIVEMFCPLMAGAQIVVIEGPNSLDVSRLARTIREHAITVIDVVPSLLSALLDSPQFATSSSLRRVVCGGEVMSPDLLNRLLNRLSVEFVNMYGPTEATITALYWRSTQPADRVPIGRPPRLYYAYVLDRDLNPLPAGVPGELHLGGECLARGYVGRPRLTQERFISDPFSSDANARLYRTGDRCRFLEDGSIEFLGRIDDQVKVRGYRIELGEVESVLAASPLVRSCAAHVVSDNSHTALAAYVVPNLGEAEFWPSIGEYFIYDELLYHIMTADRVRTRAYRSAIGRAVRNKTVVDVGTGADLALARMCLEAGAKRVFAIEMLDSAYEQASRLASQLDFQDRLVLIHGDSQEIELPGKVDVCVSELLGTIGSSEGVIEVLNDARRFLRAGGEMIPQRCLTRIAAVSLPDELVAHPEFSDIPKHYVEKVFQSVGRRFDIRTCIKNLPSSCLVSEPAIFEELVFDRKQESEQSREFRLTMKKQCRVDGFLLWLNLYPGSEELIDVLTSECSWLPLFLPVFSPGIPLQEGDVISATGSRSLGPGEFTPDYVIRGVVEHAGKTQLEFSAESRRNETSFRSNPFYNALHDALETDVSKPVQAMAEERKTTGQWRELYDELYATGKEKRNGDFDIVGWDSSYTGEPLTREEMSEQVEATVKRISSLRGKRILEIGCGTGLLLLQMAGDCERYTGTDFSHGVLEQVRHQIDERGWQHVELWERQADDFDGIEPESFDVVVLNSVVQYFPGMDYLVRVIEGACRAVRSGGSIFIGDVRSLPLLRMLNAGIELERSSRKTSVGQLRERVERRISEEKELVIEPAFFRALAGRQTHGIAGTSIQVKRGRFHNELTRFRYDVVLHVNGSARSLESHTELEWNELGSVDALGSYLRERSPAALLVRGVPSARLSTEWRKLQQIERTEPETLVSDLKLEQLVVSEGLEPEQLWALEHELGYEIQIGWAERSNIASYDLLCVARSGQATETSVWRVADDQMDVKPWSAYANVLRRHLTHQHLEHELRQHLSRKLPDYMVPSTFVWIEALPLTPTGKLNRRALPPPDASRSQMDDVYTPPATDLQRQIAATWSQVLGIEKLGIDASFFNIGGHSLLAMQVVSRLSDFLNMDIPLRLMFEKPTIRGFAEAVNDMETRAKQRSVPRPIPVRNQGKSTINPEQLTDAQVEQLISGLLAKGGAS